MKMKIDSFGDHFNPLLGNGAIWTTATTSTGFLINILDVR